MEAGSRLALPGLTPLPHSLPDPVSFSPSEPPCHERVSQEGLVQPGKLARTHGPGCGESRSWVRAVVGLGGLTWAIPSSLSSRQPFQGAQRDTTSGWDPARGRRSRASLCCFKAGPWRRDQVSHGETRQVAMAQSSREPWAQLCSARWVRGQGQECTCRYSHRVGALRSCVALGDQGTSWVCMSVAPCVREANWSTEVLAWKGTSFDATPQALGEAQARGCSPCPS